MLPALSKKQMKMADAWALNIKAKLDKGFVEGQNIAEYIDGLAKTNLQILQGTLNSSHPFESPRNQLTLLDLAISLGLMHHTTAVRKQAAMAVASLLKYATHPSKQVNDALVLYYDYFRKLHSTNTLIDIDAAKTMLYSFLEYPDTWNVTSCDADTLAHIAIQMGDEALLESALAYNPLWLEAKNKHLKETLLYTATRYRQDNIARILIEKYNADINAVNQGDLNVLANTIYFHSSSTINLLLSKGCSINAFTNVIISDDALKSSVVLMASGYFIPFTHREPINSIKISAHFGIPTDKFKNPIFYLISKDNAQDMELITNIEELKASTVIPSDVQVERLTLSFQEAMLYDKDEELSLLFETFKEKYGVKSSTAPISYYAVKEQNVKDFSFSKILYEGIKYADNAAYIEMLRGVLKAITRKESLTQLSQEEFRNTLKAFSDSLQTATGFIACNLDCTDYQSLVYLTAYKYFKHMLPQIIASSHREFYTSNEYSFINIIFVATNHILSDIEKYEIRAIATIRLTVQKLKQASVNSDVISQLELAIEIININSYSKAEFYNELFNSVEAIKSHRNSIKRKECRLESDYNVASSYINCLKNIKPNSYDTKEQVSIIHSIKLYCQMQVKKDTTILLALNALIEERTHEIHNLYATVLQSVQTPFIECTLSEDKQSLLLNFPEHFDKRKTKLLMDTMMRRYPDVKRLNNSYKLCYFGMPLYDLTAVIYELQNLNDSDLLPDAANDEDEDAVQDHAKPMSELKNYYLPPPESCTSRPMTSAYRRQASDNDVQEITSAPQAPDGKPSLDEIKNEIRGKLGLSADAEIYQMIHPRYPESRQHLCWGVWLPRAMENRPEAVTDESLERHHALLKNQARLEIHASGENGFKSTEIMNLETGKTECTYKTKRAKENLRIIAVPYQVSISTQEKASIYCFGLIDMHDKTTVEIDPRTFLEKHKANPQPNADPFCF